MKVTYYLKIMDGLTLEKSKVETKLRKIILDANKEWYKRDPEIKDAASFAAGADFMLKGLLEALRQRDGWAEEYFKDSQLQELAATAIEIENTLVLLELGSRE